MNRLTRRALPALALLGVAASPAWAQDPEKPKPPIQPRIDDLVPGGAQEASPQERMIELFQEVETRMKEMGSYLLDAGAGDTSKLDRMKESGIEELLKSAQPSGQPSGGVADLLNASRSQGQSVLSGIDEILELAAKNGGT